jgi:hypothetical protein
MSAQLLRRGSQLEGTKLLSLHPVVDGKIAKCSQSLPKKQSLVVDPVNLVHWQIVDDDPVRVSAKTTTDKRASRQLICKQR